MNTPGTTLDCIPKPFEAVVFDLDDTLVLSTVDFAKFKRMVIERMVIQGEDGSFYNPKETIVAITSRYERRMKEKRVSGKEIRRRLAELDRIMDAVELEKVSETIAIDGASDLLTYLRSKGVKIGVLTRGCQQYATEALSNTGLLSYIDCMECRNSETKAKPDPESYKNLAKALGVMEQHTLFVGDHPIDAECARNAGVKFIGVETGDVPRQLLLEAGSVAVFKNVGELVPWLRKILRD